MSKIHIASVPTGYTHSLRIRFQIEGSTVTIVSVSRVAMRALGSIAGAESDNSSGYWCEVRGANGELLYDRPMRNPLPDSLEVFEDPDGGSLRREPQKRASQATFEVIIPDLVGAEEFSFHGPTSKAKVGAVSGVLARHRMDELRALSERGFEQPSQDS
jgi:hypothetical protein